MNKKKLRELIKATKQAVFSSKLRLKEAELAEKEAREAYNWKIELLNELQYLLQSGSLTG